MNVETLPEAPTPCLPAGMHDTLLRVLEALEFIALITREVADDGRIRAEHTATLASYARDDLGHLLTGIEVLPEA